ncbi:hypothetical protein G4B88_016183 [Cannabis sativa]|uniref:Protein YIP n=1 Tax=Cannabis sativa TaxID=3483 RepID=A0A7J6F0N3_CANSA|nr:hypothetical protein G4B88_016183 [Cannabis sativa]
MIMDDLQVKPISINAVLNSLRNVEEHALLEKTSVGIHEGLRLLKASLHTKTALTQCFLVDANASRRNNCHQLICKFFHQLMEETGEGDIKLLKVQVQVIAFVYLEPFEQQPANSWKGVFSVSSYTQYFNVDTDLVLNRLLGSLHPIGGDFFTKIDANPDLYGLIWISTTLVFVLASLGNCATYLMQKNTDNTTTWSFNVSYVNVAAGSIYGYAAVVPLLFYFLLQYMGSNPSLIKFWCMWGYSLFIFVLASFLLVIPVEFLRWLIIILTGAASACFVATNLKSYIEGSDLKIVVVAAFALQLALGVFIKVWFFP